MLPPVCGTSLTIVRRLGPRLTDGAERADPGLGVARFFGDYDFASGRTLQSTVRTVQHAVHTLLLTAVHLQNVQTSIVF